ncbi:MAG: hypothetical protein LRY27_01830 [Chitinophagales bacterium]|nr:hypothetical protein [Chitinophagales bacterium]
MKQTQKNYDALICGHVHRPGINTVCSIDSHKEIQYLNSGDWTESCTALEYNKGKWKLYQHDYNFTGHETALKEVKFEKDDVYPFLRKDHDE